ncbi:type IV pilus modification protein PilV [Uliginosibacterium sp. H3]|uniref:Type IV pilus modification protein PilV n=1 Tax=Uliginosibacterium silvisoli TaxID=3114758 RepID=A0ABU6K636_9RHOO|nr:type IV pilus modification protein PilV [Uliginosibacterium sp. H3]
MRKTRVQQVGVALIEVMVSVAILALGLLGMAGMQARSLMMNQSSHYRSIAADLAGDLADRIHANRSPYLSGSGSATSAPLPPDFSKCTQGSTDKSTTSCLAQGSGVQSYRASTEISEWNTTVRAQLPSATWSLTKESGAISGYYRYTLSITWLDDRTTAGNATYSVVIE